MSAGWQSSAAQIASSVEKRIARAFPFLRMDRLASVMSTFSESSVSVMRRACSRSSSRTMIGISDGACEVVAHSRAMLEDTREHEQQQHGDAARDVEAPLDIDRKRVGR